MKSWLVKKKGYVFDRRIFIGTVLLLVFMVFGVFVQYGFRNHIYARCPEDSLSDCRNPYLVAQQNPYLVMNPDVLCSSKNEELCNIPTLRPGEEYGEPPPWMFMNFPLVALSIVGLAFMMNHLQHNVGGGLWKKLR